MDKYAHKRRDKGTFFSFTPYSLCYKCTIMAQAQIILIICLTLTDVRPFSAPSSQSPLEPLLIIASHLYQHVYLIPKILKAVH